jgi:hypothetical protein
MPFKEADLSHGRLRVLDRGYAGTRPSALASTPGISMRFLWGLPLPSRMTRSTRAVPVHPSLTRAWATPCKLWPNTRGTPAVAVTASSGCRR